MPRKPVPVPAIAQAAALAHPLRVAVWLEVLERGSASPSAIAEHLEQPLANTAYHVRRLLGLGVLEASGTTQRRGAVEHYYRAVKTPSDLWLELMPDRPESERVRAVAGELDRIAGDVADLYGAAIGAGELRGVASRLEADAAVLDELERQGAEVAA